LHARIVFSHSIRGEWNLRVGAACTLSFGLFCRFPASRTEFQRFLALAPE
jgi:hypothetical protein